MSRVRQVADIEDIPDLTYNPFDEDILDPPPQTYCAPDQPITPHTVTRRVNVTQSPYLHAFFNHHPLRLTIDTGAETNMIKASLASYIKAPISKSSQLALQADGRTPLSIVGETRLSLSRDGHTLTLEALVVEDLDFIAGSDIVSYGTPSTSSKYHAVRWC